MENAAADLCSTFVQDQLDPDLSLADMKLVQGVNASNRRKN
jgi:hypothetical protein